MIYLNVAVKGIACSSAAHALDFRSSIIWCVLCDAARRDIWRKVPPLLHTSCMNASDLLPPCSVWQTHFHMHLKAARAQQCRVQQVEAVGHADDEHIVYCVYAVNVRQELIHNRVAYACVAVVAATLFAQRIDFIKDNDMQAAVVAFLVLLCTRLCKQRPHILLTLPHKLTQHLRSIHNFRLSVCEQFSNLPGNQRLAAARGAMQ